MSDPDTSEYLFFFALVLLSAIFSAMETALTSLNKSGLQRISEQGPLRAHFVAMWEGRPDRVIAGLMIGNIGAIVAASILGSQMALRHTAGLARSHGWTFACTVALVTPILLIIGQTIPRALGRRKAEALASLMAGPIRAFTWITAPLAWLLTSISSGVLYAFGERAASLPPQVTEEEVRALVEAGVEEGGIEQEERELIHSIFEFADTTVREVMVPRVDMTCVEASMPMEEILDIFAEKKFSRMPVYDEVVDNIVGLVHIKNILNFWRRDIKDMKAMEFVALPHFVPETKKIIELLEEFRQKQFHMAIVVDEYGGTAGLVTMEDLIEEIVGEIEDEVNRDTQPIRKTGQGSYVVDARVEIDHLNEALDLRLPKEEFETVGGLLFHRLGKIPTRGEGAELDGVRITVLDGDVKRVRRVRVEMINRDEKPNPSTP